MPLHPKFETIIDDPLLRRSFHHLMNRTNTTISNRRQFLDVTNESKYVANGRLRARHTPSLEAPISLRRRHKPYIQRWISTPKSALKYVCGFLPVMVYLFGYKTVASEGITSIITSRYSHSRHLVRSLREICKYYHGKDDFLLCTIC